MLKYVLDIMEYFTMKEKKINHKWDIETDGLS